MITKWLNVKMFLILGILSTTLGFIHAQNVKIDPGNSSIDILGTSNLHDWDSKVEKVSGDFSLNASREIESLKLVIPVKSIKSGNSIMDSKTRDAFNEAKNPNITFQLTGKTAPLLNNGKDLMLTITGNLSMGGTTKAVSFQLAGKSSNATTYLFKGTTKLKMSDFKMSAPTAVFGTLKTGDEVTLKFKIQLLEQK
jgi:polyisoprenoid-binding protein YceI